MEIIQDLQECDEIIYEYFTEALYDPLSPLFWHLENKDLKIEQNNVKYVNHVVYLS